MTHKRAVITNLLLYCFPVLILVGLSQLVYLNSLTNQFVYDDEFILSDNPFIKSWGNLPKLFHKDYFEFSGELSYRPVVTLSYFFDYTFWGLNPFGYHLVNALLHSLNAVLCFFLFKHFIQHRTASFIGALIFSCHPVLSETVNAIGFREDILATAFLLTGFLLYVKAVRKYSFLMYLVSVACYLLGVFSKEMAIPLLLLIFIYDILHTKNINYVQKLTHYYSGYLIVAVFYLLVRFVLLHNPVESTVSYPDNSLLVNFLTMSKVVASYITKLFLPVRLCADYIVPHSTSVLDFSFIVSFLTLAATAVIACKLYLYSRILFFSCVWFFTSLLPVLNIIPIENIMAERYLYLPATGFCMFCGAIVAAFYGKNRYVPFYKRKGIIVFFILIVAIFSFRTFTRNKVWKNQNTLWSNIAKTSPNSFKAHNNLGNFYRDAGMPDRAIDEFKQALTLYEDYADAHNNLGVTYRKKGMLREAFLEYQKTLQLDPNYADTHNNLGVLYTKLGKIDLAVEEFKLAIKNKPVYPEAHNNLGLLYVHTGDLDLAIDEFKNAILEEPDYFQARNNLGAAYLKKEVYHKAIKVFHEAIKYNNRSAKTYYHLSVAYYNTKQFDKALETAKKALAINPNHQETLSLINTINIQLGNSKKNP